MRNEGNSYNIFVYVYDIEPKPDLIADMKYAKTSVQWSNITVINGLQALQSN